MLSSLTPDGQAIPDAKRIVIIGGGTSVHIANHLAISAPAYGQTAKAIARHFEDHADTKMKVDLRLTRMAGGAKDLESPADVARLVDEVVADVNTRIVIFNPAIVDYTPYWAQQCANDEFNEPIFVGPELEEAAFSKDFRFETGKAPELSIDLKVGDKLVKHIRRTRKDLLLVAFKTTCGATEDEMYIKGLKLLKGASCNLVLVNDSVTKLNMIVTPEEARYHVTSDRDEALKQLVDMALLRSHLHFTRSTVVAGEAVAWNDARVPNTLRAVVDGCIAAGAYKPFEGTGSTVGHFAVKLAPTTFLTSRRKTNFNDLPNLGLVLVETDGEDTVTAYGHKPSVGGQSQRIIFGDHPELDSIVHFHCPLREDAVDAIPVASQREFECGSHECGENTSKNLQRFEIAPGQFVWAVHLDNHGPNIVFRSDSVDPEKVLDFIHRNWDLTGKTGGPVSLPEAVTA